MFKAIFKVFWDLLKALFSLLKPYFPYKAVAPDGNVVFFSLIL